MTTSVMAGGTLGAAVFGYVADRYGRKSACLFCLVGCALSNCLLLLAAYHWLTALVALFAIGVFAGGYMVVNFVLLTESVGDRWRLLCSCLSGWPFGMMAMSLLAYVSRRWDTYHVLVSAVSLFCLILIYVFAVESPRWLLARGNHAGYRTTLIRISRVNGTEEAIKDYLDSVPLLSDNGQCDSATILTVKQRPYSYIDLIRNKVVMLRLISLTYCWLAASVISFGLYFNTGSLAGDLYLNTFLTGIFKGAVGLVPMLVDPWMGRKPILIFFVCVTCICCSTAAVLRFVDDSVAVRTALTVVIIVGISSIDPVWKINHLYSTELFPTVVRNMARGVCNVGSRMGSLLGPQVAYLASVYAPAPYLIYGILSIVYLFVSVICLPETKDKALPDHLI